MWASVPTVCAVDDGAYDIGTERADVGIGPYGVCGRRWCIWRGGMGRYTIRPYGPAFGPLVGADAHIGPPASVCKAVR